MRCVLFGQLISPLVSPQSSVFCYISKFYRVSGGNDFDCSETVCNRFVTDVILFDGHSGREAISPEYNALAGFLKKELQASVYILVNSVWYTERNSIRKADGRLRGRECCCYFFTCCDYVSCSKSRL